MSALMRLSTLRHTRVAALIAAVALAVPSTAVAQQRLPPMRVFATAQGDNARADTLERWAASMYDARWQWPNAARLHERAALLRGYAPRAVASWRMSAWLYSAADNNGRARTMMERAAASAAAGGDVERAANSYIDAILLAMEARRPEPVPGLLVKTRAVLHSPLLPAERREAILRRVGEDSRLASLSF